MMEKAGIVIADDNPLAIALLNDSLSAEGYNVYICRNGLDALKTVQKLLPDIVLLDVVMPGMNGYDVCREIKNDEKTRFIPVIIITALDELQYKIKGIESGCDDFLTKPFNKMELLARVKSLVRVKRLYDQLENTEAVIFAIAATVEARDPYTEGHLHRLAEYSSKLGKVIGLDQYDQQILHYGGILHDIGKIGISEAILGKKGHLTSPEYQLMKEHTRIGERICLPLRFSKQVGPIVRGHHERWNGKGYPDGFRSEDIPVGARIVSVVDAYDAMTTDRPYRKAMAVEKAIRILKNGAGKQWDPTLVDALLSGVLEP